jgi:hypothetical protein
VHDHHRPNEKQVGRTTVRPNLQLRLVLRHDLALPRCLGLDELRPNVGANDVRLPHVAHPEHEAQVAVALANHRVLGEQQGLGSMLWTGHLGEHDADHEGLDHDAVDGLEAHDEDRLGALLGGGSHAIADGVLRFDGEQEAGRERVDVEDARLPAIVGWNEEKLWYSSSVARYFEILTLHRRQVHRLQIPVCK